MTLTEQWEKGELPSGWYYTKLWKGCYVIDKFIGNQFLRYDDSDIVEVIAPVPSYEEYLSLTYAKEEDEKIIAEYEKENIQLHKFLEEFNALDVAKENKKLKDLLKEIRGKLKYINTPKNQHNIFGNVMMAKIDEVLK